VGRSVSLHRSRRGRVTTEMHVTTDVALMVRSRRDDVFESRDPSRPFKRPRSWDSESWKSNRYLHFNFPGFVPTKYQDRCPDGSVRVVSTTLFVGSVPKSAEEKALRELFSRYGQVESVRIMEGQGSAFVKFSSRAAAEAAKYDARSLVLEGSSLKVGWGRGTSIDKSNFDQTTGESYLSRSDYAELMAAVAHAPFTLEPEDVSLPQHGYSAADDMHGRWAGEESYEVGLTREPPGVLPLPSRPAQPEQFGSPRSSNGSAPQPHLPPGMHPSRLSLFSQSS